MLNEVRLILITGMDVHYKFCGKYMKEEYILDDIHLHDYIKVTDAKRELTIFPDKVIGCYIRRG